MTLIQRVNALSTAIGSYIKNSVLPRLLPAGGAVGQILTKSAAGNYLTGWTDKNANFSFEQVATLPTTNLVQGRIVDLAGGAGLHRYNVANAGLGIVAGWTPVVSTNGLDDSSGSSFIGANEAQIYQANDSLSALSSFADQDRFSLTELVLPLDTQNPFPVNAAYVTCTTFTIQTLHPYIISNAGSPRAIRVGNADNAIKNDTVPLANGDIVIPRKIASNNSWAYYVIPANPIADTDYVALFNTAIA